MVQCRSNKIDGSRCERNAVFNGFCLVHMQRKYAKNYDREEPLLSDRVFRRYVK